MKQLLAILIVVIAVVAGYMLLQKGSSRMGGRMMMEGMHDSSPVQYNPDAFTEEMRISRGGQLYDNWWKTTVDAEKPKEDHPLWESQTTNKRSGYDTYRCKECHGWDYRGKDGAYGKGSHFTGFKGVYEASQKMTIKDLEGALNGSAARGHDFSNYLSSRDIADLALFMKKGLIDTGIFVDTEGVPSGGDLNSGTQLFNSNCAQMCHGGSGGMINFGDDKKPEFIGTVANKNPWEFIHKVRAGQPGTKMPSAIMNGWSSENILDLLIYARTLPKDADEAEKFVSTIDDMDHPHQTSADEYRGFGPLMN